MSSGCISSEKSANESFESRLTNNAITGILSLAIMVGLKQNVCCVKNSMYSGRERERG